MKLLKKLLIVDIVLLALTVLFFKVPFVGFILTGVTFGLGVYIFLGFKDIRAEVKHQESIPKEELRRMAIDEKLRKARATIESTAAFRNANYSVQEASRAVQEANRQISVFNRKSDALKVIMGLNEGSCSGVLAKNSLDVYETLVENYRRISKRIVAYETTENEEIQREISKILEANEKLLDLYNRLIEEVSRMGDNLNEQDESLQNLISNMQELRRSNGGEEDSTTDDDPFVIEIPDMNKTKDLV